MRKQYCIARMATSTAAFRQNGTVLAGQAVTSQQMARLSTYEPKESPYFWWPDNSRSTWRFIALTAVAVVVVWAGAAVLLSLELTFAPAVLLR
jgi:anti-sigma-K factor RskA